MRPIASSTFAVQLRHDEQPVPNQPVRAEMHRLAEVKLKSPYKDAIPAFLQEHQVRITQDAAFDDCIFQSVLFTHFFEKLETGELKPGQPEHDRPAQYLLNKSVELLQPLSVKIEATCRRYDELLVNARPARRAKLERELQFVRGMAARFQTLESNLLGALAHPQDFSPTRDKACFLLFAHAMLSDAANEVQRWVDDLDGDLPHATGGAERLVRSYMTRNEPTSNLFSSGPLTPADEELYRKCLTISWKLDGIESFPVPSFARTGSQGVRAILHCIFQGKCLLTGAIEKPHQVHDNFFRQQDLATLRHDAGHLQVMIKEGVFSSTAPELLSIYRKLEDPQGNLAPQDVKRDLFLLFYLLHENTQLLASVNPALSTRNREKSFLDCAREFFYSDFFVLDTISVLNKVGFSIAPFDNQSSHEEKVACYEAVAQAMDSLWKEFRGRHGDDLVASGLFAKLPKFLAD